MKDKNAQPAAPAQMNSPNMRIQQKLQSTLHPETSSHCKLYHFTDKEGYEAILESGKIKISISGLNDAAGGPGVYLTSIPPNGSFSKLQIAKNNYGGIYEQKMEKVFHSLEYVYCTP